MRVVVDTTVVVSAVLRDRDPEKVLRLIAERSDVEWLASAAILQEYEEVLRRPKFGLPAAVVDRWMHLFGQIISTVEASGHIEFPRDPKDAIFLACAMTAEADFLITSDKEFTQASKLMRTYIVSVAQFLSLTGGPK